MASIRWHHSVVTGSAWAAWAVLAACEPEGATAGAVPPPPPPVSVAPPPVAVAPSPPPVAPPAPVAVAPPNPNGAELAEGDEHRAHHHGGVLGLITLSIKDLDLTANEHAAVDKIRADFVAKMEPARAAGNALANVLADGVAAGAVDHAKADAAIGKLVTEVQKLHDASLESMNQLHAALTAPERAALVDNLQAHWEKWKEAHGRDEQDDRQHRPGYLLGLVKGVGLTKEQAEKIKGSFHDRMKSNPQDAAHNEVQDHLKAFAAAFKSDTFDAKKVAGGKAADGHIARWGATRRARFLEAAAPVLTPDQRAKLAQMIREHGLHADT